MSILKMDIFNTDALIQMLEAVQAKGYKIAAAYILEKINTCNKNDDERFKIRKAIFITKKRKSFSTCYQIQHIGFVKISIKKGGNIYELRY